MKDIKPADADNVTGAAKLLPPMDTTYLQGPADPAQPVPGALDIIDYAPPEDLPK